jgi:molybdenum cofactor synthesis domain-containing protein
MALGCNVEILSIGNELLLGNTVNTNASWIASRVTTLGGNVTRITTVADNLEEISQALREAIRRRPAFIITTGGIGPTFDDMTMHGVAKGLRVRLRLDRAAVMMIREHYARGFPKSHIELTKPRLKMARLPFGAVAIRNPIGTAPGARLNVRGIGIFCLPGVPREAKAIFRETISSSIGARARGSMYFDKWVRVQGVMESVLAPLVDRTMRRWAGVYVKSHPRGVEAGGRPMIELHFSARARNQKNAERVVLGAVKSLLRELREHGAQIGPVR